MGLMPGKKLIQSRLLLQMKTSGQRCTVFAAQMTQKHTHWANKPRSGCSASDLLFLPARKWDCANNDHDHVITFEISALHVIVGCSLVSVMIKI
jgi:hypothetical protein